MKCVDLPDVNRLREVFDYNADTGELIWKMRVANCTQIGSVAGWKAAKYLQVTLDGKHYYTHRIIWKMVYGQIGNTSQIDHINGVHTDNRLCNLRLVDQSTNMKNQTMPKNNSSGIIGVRFHDFSGLWVGYIKSNGVIQQKYCRKMEDAILWRKQKEKELGFHNNHGRKKSMMEKQI